MNVTAVTSASRRSVVAGVVYICLDRDVLVVGPSHRRYLWVNSLDRLTEDYQDLLSLMHGGGEALPINFGTA